MTYHNPGHCRRQTAFAASKAMQVSGQFLVIRLGVRGFLGPTTTVPLHAGGQDVLLQRLRATIFVTLSAAVTAVARRNMYSLTGVAHNSITELYGMSHTMSGARRKAVGVCKMLFALSRLGHKLLLRDVTWEEFETIVLVRFVAPLLVRI